MRLQYEYNCRCYILLFEERARESMVVARLMSNDSSRSESNTHATFG